MRRHLLWIAVLVLAGACSGADPEQEGARVPERGWPAVASSLTGRFDASSSNVCTRGAPECIDLVIDELTVRADRLVATCDHQAPFSLAYLTTVRGLREALKTADPATASYLRHLDSVFARMYFDATDAWASGRIAAVPLAWQRAFQAAAQRQVTGLGDLLAGMNAHITRDLSFAVASVGLSLPDGRSAKPAFDQVNAVLRTVQQPIIDEVARRLDSTVAQADLSRIDPAATSIGLLLAGWREESWVNANRLATASAADRPAVEAAIESHADARALSIIVGTSYVPFLSSTVPRDQHCMVNGRR